MLGEPSAGLLGVSTCGAGSARTDEGDSGCPITINAHPHDAATSSIIVRHRLPLSRANHYVEYEVGVASV